MPIFKGGMMTVAKAKTIRVKLIKSPSGYSRHQKAVVKGLGLGRLNSTKELKNTAPVRGMINKVIHLVQYEFIS